MTILEVTSETPTPRAFETLVWGGLLAGTLDALDGVAAFGLHGLNPVQVLQYIASGLLGVASFQGGLKTAGLGALLHYFIAFAVAAVYYGASAVPRSPFSVALFLNGVIGHAIFVGFPIAWFAHRSATPR